MTTRLDQLSRVVEILSKDPMSRQAVITLWDPLKDLAPTYKQGMIAPTAEPRAVEVRFKDYPCTNWLHFQIVRGKLNLTVVMRSNDAVWGMSAVNILNFTLLQDLVAAILNIDVGSYYHMADNLHVYEEFYGMRDRVALGNWWHAFEGLYDCIRPTGHFWHPVPCSLSKFTYACQKALDLVEATRISPGFVPKVPAIVLALPEDASPWLIEWVYFMGIHNLLGTEFSEQEVEVALANVYRADWRVAACGFLTRHAVRKGFWTVEQAGALAHRVCPEATYLIIEDLYAENPKG